MCRMFNTWTVSFCMIQIFSSNFFQDRKKVEVSNMKLLIAVRTDIISSWWFEKFLDKKDSGREDERYHKGRNSVCVCVEKWIFFNLPVLKRSHSHSNVNLLAYVHVLK